MFSGFLACSLRCGAGFVWVRAAACGSLCCGGLVSGWGVLFLCCSLVGGGRGGRGNETERAQIWQIMFKVGVCTTRCI